MGFFFLRVCIYFFPVPSEKKSFCRKVKESERIYGIRATQSFRVCTLVNFAFLFCSTVPKRKFMFFLLLFILFFWSVQCDIIDCDFLCVIITISPFFLLFNASHHAKKNLIGSQKQHFHLPPLFYFTSDFSFAFLLLL